MTARKKPHLQIEQVPCRIGGLPERVPAAELEEQIVVLTLKALSAPTAISQLMPNLHADTISCIRSALADSLHEAQPAGILNLVETITITPGHIKLQMNATSAAVLLDVNQDSINDDVLKITAPFQMRKRGVETKLIFSDVRVGQDDALIRNIAKAQHWFAQIKSGKTFAEIAISEGTSKRRIQQMIDLAFLAPDIIRDVLHGKQPIGFTSDWVKRHDLPSDWSAQRKLLTTL